MRLENRFLKEKHISKEGRDVLVMTKNRNSIIFLSLILIAGFTLGCKNVSGNTLQLKESSKVAAIESGSDNKEKNNSSSNTRDQSKTDSEKENLTKNIEENQLKLEVERIYNERSASLLSGDVSPLKTLFDTSQKYGQWALEHEIKRVKYLNDWAKERNITFRKIESSVRIKKIYPKGDIIKTALEESYKFDYVYGNDANSPINSFGVGIRHTTSLIKKNDQWVIYNDWYTDCFEDALQSYSANISQATISLTPLYSINNSSQTVNNWKRFYDRDKAVAYADKYCGAAWGSSNNFKYNKKYTDYNGIGGDCTNYASQVLGDKEGGGMPIGGAWTPGSRAWANADGLKNYLTSSGRGSVISVGTFKELTKPSQKLPNGAIGKLQLGDLIAYEKSRGNIDHFAVVTGFDSHGYPLINSHTTDRYHVPWDLGWGDAKIRFFLIHING